MAVGEVSVRISVMCLVIIVVMTRTINTFRGAFFRFADTDSPSFFMTKREIQNAMNADAKWKKDAEEMNIWGLFNAYAVERPGAVDGYLGLEMERFHSWWRNYACK